MSLRDCFRLQRVPVYSAIQLTVFGRAELDSGNLGPAGLDAPDRYCMLYWVKLPMFGHFYCIYRDCECFGQRVLFWHMQHGFSLRWHELPDPLEAGP